MYVRLSLLWPRVRWRCPVTVHSRFGVELCGDVLPQKYHKSQVVVHFVIRVTRVSFYGERRDTGGVK